MLNHFKSTLREYSSRSSNPVVEQLEMYYNWTFNHPDVAPADVKRKVIAKIDVYQITIVVLAKLANTRGLEPEEGEFSGFENRCAITRAGF